MSVRVASLELSPERAPLLDPDLARALMTREVGRFGAAGSTIERCTLVAAKKKLRKLILEYRLTVRSRNGRTTRLAVIGKAYATDRGAHAFRSLASLRRGGLTGRYTVPEPLAYVAERRLLLQTKAPGTQLSRRLFHGRSGRPAAVLAARWLARLHGLPPEVADGPVGDGPEIRLARYARELSSVAPELEARLGAIVRRISSQYTGPGVPRVPVHGDYHPKNIFIRDRTVTVIDTDTFALGEAAADVGYFVAQCAIMSYHRHRDFGRARAPVHAFVRAYRSAAPRSRLDRAPTFAAAAFIQSLHYELCILRTGKWALIPLWLEQAEGLLDSPDTLGHAATSAGWR